MNSKPKPQIFISTEALNEHNGQDDSSSPLKNKLGLKNLLDKIMPGPN